MGFWSRLFDAPDVISDGVKAVINTGDALVYTDEERARANQQVLDWQLKWAQATTGQNLARRLIALAVTTVWLLMAVAAATLAVWGSLNPEIAPAADAMTDQFARMTVIEGMILTYYFVPNKIGEAVQKYQQARGTQTDSIRGK